MSTYTHSLRAYACLITLLFSQSVWAQHASPHHDTLITHILNPFKNLSGDLEAGFVTPKNTPNWNTLSIALGTTMGAILTHAYQDEPFGNASQAPQLGSLSKNISNMSLPLALALPLGFYASGSLRASGYGRSKSFEVGEQMVESLMLTAATTFVMKYTAGRTRPDLSNRYSFPSGHSSIVFASATSLALNTPWYVGVPVMLSAGLVGVSRLDLHQHFLSDVISGAGIGAFLATAVWSHHRTLESDNTVAWAPWIISDAIGVTFTH